MLKEDDYLNADTFLTPPNGGVCSDEDSDIEDTVDANHLSGSQLSAQAQYRAKYGHATIDSMLEDNFEEGYAITISTQSYAADEVNISYKNDYSLCEVLQKIFS